MILRQQLELIVQQEGKRLDERLASLGSTGVEQRLTGIEATLDGLVKQLAAVRKEIGEAAAPAKPARKPKSAKPGTAKPKPSAG